MKKKTVLLIFLLLTLLLLSTNVLAQRGNILEDIFGPLFGALDITDFYNDYASVVDFILGTILFIGVAQMSLGRLPQFQERGGRAVIIIVGMILSIGLSVWMNNQGVRMGDLGPVGALILVVVIGYSVYAFFKGLGQDRIGASAASYVLVYAALSSFGLVKALEERLGEGRGRIIFAIANLIFGVLLIFLFYKFGTAFTKLFRGEGEPDTTPTPGPTPPVTPTPSRRRRRELQTFAEFLRGSRVPGRAAESLLLNQLPDIVERLNPGRGGVSLGSFLNEMLNENDPFKRNILKLWYLYSTELFLRHRDALRGSNINRGLLRDFEQATRDVIAAVRADSRMPHENIFDDDAIETFRNSIYTFGGRHGSDLRGASSRQIDDLCRGSREIRRGLQLLSFPIRRHMYDVWRYILQSFRAYYGFKRDMP